MGLFDLFSNDSAEKARDLANAGATKGYADLSGLYGQGRDALTGAFSQGRDALTGAIGQGTNAITGAYGQGRNALNQNFGAAGDLYKNLLTSYAPGATAYGNVSGANGAAGSAKAYDDFLHSGAYGGFNFANDAGLQAIARQHAAAGNAASGNADTDAAKFTTGLAGQTWKDYQGGLLPYLQGTANATAGAAGVATGLGSGLNANYGAEGNAINSNYGTLGTGLNANYGAEGTGLNSSYQGQGGAANTTATTIGNNNAGAELNNYKVGANIWNGLMGAGNFLAGGAGGQGGIGGLATNAKSLFSAFA